MNTPINLLVTAPFDPARIAQLSPTFEVTTLEPLMEGTSLAERDIDAELGRAEAIICELDRIDNATLDKAPNLKVVVSCRANPVNVDIDACSARGISVLTTPARNADVTADLAFTLLLMTVRHAGRAERWLRDENWVADDVFAPYSLFRGIQLAGRTLGILGGGAVGRRVLERARGFGMNVLVYDPFLAADAFGDEARVVDLQTVLADSDIVTVHVPLMDSTVGLIGAEELALMKPDAYLVNAARAAIVDETALVDALQKRSIAGAGLDVFWTEPIPNDHPLLRLDNVTITPHIAGASDDVVSVHSRIAAEGLTAWASGGVPAHVANAAALEKMG